MRLQLVANNNLLVYTNAGTDPYTNNNGSTMLGQNQTNVDAVIGTANYDVGHVFSTGGGGVAYLGVPCETGFKARASRAVPRRRATRSGWTTWRTRWATSSAATTRSTARPASCSGGNRNASTAYEPGSGSTIMAYAGICGAEDLQPHSDAYFHSVSFDEIVTYTTIGAGSTCGTMSATGNSLPVPSVAGRRLHDPEADALRAHRVRDRRQRRRADLQLGGVRPRCRGRARDPRPIRRSSARGTRRRARHARSRACPTCSRARWRRARSCPT